MRRDFIALEKAVALAYSNLKKNSNPSTRNDFVIAVKDLAYSILMVDNWNKYEVDYDVVSYEYAVYMFQRIVTNTLSPHDTFPWTEYIRKNIRYIIVKVKNNELWFDFVDKLRTEEFSEALKEIVVDENTPIMDIEIDKEKLGKRIHRALRMFFSQEEINRLYPLASDVIYLLPEKPISDDLPDDLKDFIKVLICVGKRLDDATEVKFSLNDVSVETFRKAIQVAVRSTLFLAASFRTNYFPRDLLLALDIDSLYRFLQITGNVTLLKRLEREQLAVVTASNMLIEGKGFEEAFQAAKKELDFEIGFGSIRRMVSNIIESFYLFRDGKETDPIIDVMISAFRIMDKLGNKIPDIIDAGVSVDNILKIWREMSTSLSNLINQTVKVSSSYPNDVFKKSITGRSYERKK